MRQVIVYPGEDDIGFQNAQVYQEVLVRVKKKKKLL